KPAHRRSASIRDRRNRRFRHRTHDLGKIGAWFHPWTNRSPPGLAKGNKQVFAIAEVSINSPCRHPGTSRDLLQSRAFIALLTDQRARRFQEFGPRTVTLVAFFRHA